MDIPSPNIQRIMLTIYGTSPIIFHKWSEKAKKQIRDKVTGKAQSKTKEAKDRVAEYYASFYTDSDGHIAFPAVCLKMATVASGRVLDIPMTQLRQSIFVNGDKHGMIKVLIDDKPIKLSDKKDLIFYKEEDCPPNIIAYDKAYDENVQMREDMIRVQRGGADMRWRGQVSNWSMKLPITYSKNMLSDEQVANLVETAGFSCGIGEWRPEKSGDNGTFSLIKQ